jgi:hypothetical protein
MTICIGTDAMLHAMFTMTLRDKNRRVLGVRWSRRFDFCPKFSHNHTLGASGLLSRQAFAALVDTPVMVECALCLCAPPRAAPPPSTLATDMLAMLDASACCDVTLLVGSASILAHKAVLAARSPVFKAMFTNHMQESKENIVHLDDVETSSFGLFLRFLYSSVLPSCPIDLAAMLVLADRFQCTSMVTACVDRILDHDNVQGMASLFELDRSLSPAWKLKERAMDALRNNIALSIKFLASSASDYLTDEEDRAIDVQARRSLTVLRPPPLPIPVKSPSTCVIL